MKKVMLIAAIVVASFTAQARERYKIEIRTLDGRAVYLPFTKERVHHLLPEWRPLSYVAFYTRQEALDRISIEKARVKANNEYKKVSYVYID
jgi:hypothetical protein